MTTTTLSGSSSSIPRRLLQGTGLFLLAALFIDAGLFLAGVTPLLIPGAWIAELRWPLLLLVLLGLPAEITIRKRPPRHRIGLALGLCLGIVTTVTLGFALTNTAKDDAVRFACEQSVEQENAIAACSAKATLSLVDSERGNYWVDLPEQDGSYLYLLDKYHQDGSRLSNLIQGHRTHFVVREKRKQLEPGAPAITP